MTSTWQDPESDSITPKVSMFHLKVTCHKKNQEGIQINEKKKSTDTNTKMTEKVISSDKDIKAAMIKNTSMCS